MVAIFEQKMPSKVFMRPWPADYYCCWMRTADWFSKQQ